MKKLNSQYKNLKILFIGKKRVKVFNFFKKQKINFLYKKNFSHNINYRNFNFLISYGCSHIFKKEIINYFGKKIINCHQSYLPWNRGADPNFWSFIDDTPKGVTIHRINEKIDKGEILVRKRLKMDNNILTFKTSYIFLLNQLDNLLIDNFKLIFKDKIKPIKQPDIGTFNNKNKKRKFFGIKKPTWNKNINKFLLEKNSNV